MFMKNVVVSVIHLFIVNTVSTANTLNAPTFQSITKHLMSKFVLMALSKTAYSYVLYF